MGTVVEIHRILSNTIWLYFLALGVWGTFRAIRSQGVDGRYLGAAAIGEMLFALQGIMGLVLWLGGQLGAVERPAIHILYGAFAVVFLPFLYLVALRGDDTNRAQWVLGLGTLFLFGVALRAIGTGV